MRAEKIARNAGTKIGRVASARMGVFQITGANTNEEFSAGGSFNTSSRQQEGPHYDARGIPRKIKGRSGLQKSIQNSSHGKTCSGALRTQPHRAAASAASVRHCTTTCSPAGTTERMILRIEDTDSQRFVPGAEEYILESLRWCGIEIDEGVGVGGPTPLPSERTPRDLPQVRSAARRGGLGLLRLRYGRGIWTPCAGKPRRAARPSPTTTPCARNSPPRWPCRPRRSARASTAATSGSSASRCPKTKRSRDG